MTAADILMLLSQVAPKRRKWSFDTAKQHQ